MYVPFELEIPNHLDDALPILADESAKPAIPLAGGTNLIVDMRAKRVRPKRILSVDQLFGAV